MAHCKKWRVRALVVAAVLCVGSLAGAHLRLFDSALGVYLHWKSPHSISFVIQAQGSDDIAGGSHFTALRNAADAWNELDGTAFQLVEDQDSASQARTDWQADDLHLLAFDETNSSGFFPAFTGIVAITPIFYTGAGRILDADVLFNGATYAFTTSGEVARFDVQSVATHELGHLLGLDHSGWGGASMYPYVDVERVSQRSLSRDEHNGMRDAYPEVGAGSLRGSIRRAQGNTFVKGAHVVVRDALGRTAGSDLTDAAGNYRIHGLASDLYELFATPFEGPVSIANVIGVATVETDFQPTIGATFAVGTGQHVSAGTLLVDQDASIVLGQPFDALPATCPIGSLSAHALHGSGLVAGSTIECSDPTVSIAGLGFGTSVITFTVDVPPGTPAGHADVTVIDPGGGRATLVGALEFVAEAPTVVSLTPSSGPTAGGTSLLVHGTGFAPGLRLVLGQGIYEEGQVGGCTWIDATTLTLVTKPHAPSTPDAVVIDATGVEGRLSAAYQFVSAPTIASVFPAVGNASGGTSVRLEGTDFAPGAVVRIAGVQQTQVAVQDAQTLLFTTAAGAAGGPYTLEVQNLDSSIASSVFSYAAQPDPVLAGLSPAVGSTKGGTQVTLSGSAFLASMEVWFGVDPATGAGGVKSSSVEFVGASSLRALAPPHAKGSVSVLVRDTNTGQASLLVSAFQYQQPKSGGGGGCSVAEAGRGWDGPRGPVEFLAPFALAYWAWRAFVRDRAGSTSRTRCTSA